MTRLPALLTIILICAGCHLPLTRSTVLVAEPAAHAVSEVAWLRLPDADTTTTRSRLESGMASALAKLPTERSDAYRRYWAANLSYLFTVIHVAPATVPAVDSVSTNEPRSQVLIALRLPAGLPHEASASLDGDGALRLVVGGDALPDHAVAGAWSLHLGAWPELTGPPGRLACWDPIRLQIEDARRIGPPLFATGMVIDRPTWEALAAGTAAGVAESGPLRSTAYVATANPLRWLATPFTLLIDACSFGEDAGGRQRTRAVNRWDAVVMTDQK